MIVYPELRTYGYSLQLDNSSKQKKMIPHYIKVF